MARAYYSAKIGEFIGHSESYILGELAKQNQFDLTDLQRNAWIEQISLLKEVLTDTQQGTVIFEYTIPRIGRRIDVVLLIDGVGFLVEFKCGDYSYTSAAIEQVLDYALDLKNFHKASHNMYLVPMLVVTNAPAASNNYSFYEDNIAEPILCNSNTLRDEIAAILNHTTSTHFSEIEWIDSPYTPTPTIIEAAQALYNNHDVKEISRSDASAENLSITSAAIEKIIADSIRDNRKSICFITGVPGAGKTLAGLNIACNGRENLSQLIKQEDDNEKVVFLSGNGPLVMVLREALARDYVKNNGGSKKDAERSIHSFVQNVHHFRDDALNSTNAPYEKVAIFDEAQRAWNEEQASKYIKKKKGISNFNKSEPEFLIDVMDRHKDWSVIVCLIGGGQEINDGEAGIMEWFSALRSRFSYWDVYLSDNIVDTEYCPEGNLLEQISGLNYRFVEGLHLGVSLRSFRSEKLAGFVKALLDVDCDAAKRDFEELVKTYPIVLTRDLDTAKKWIKKKARGSERYGVIASSGGKRLRSDGIWVQNKIDPVNWFLNGKDDVRSSYFLEETATEFDIQGLELDYTIVAWDANFRFDGQGFICHNFAGTKWQQTSSLTDRNYLKNAYRVLLTRARQGMVIYVPTGDNTDKTRPAKYFDNTYRYLRQLGISSIDNGDEISMVYDVNSDQPKVKISKPKAVKISQHTVDCCSNLVQHTVIAPVNDDDQSVGSGGQHTLCEKKVGVIAQGEFANLLQSGRVGSYIINMLQTEEYSKIQFGCGYCILKHVANKLDSRMLSLDKNGRPRYYKKLLTIDNKYYILTSQWYDSSKEKLIAFINRYNLDK